MNAFVLAVLLPAAAAEVHLGYTAAADISGYLVPMHDSIVALNTALGDANWTAALDAYTTAPAGAAHSLQALATSYPAGLSGDAGEFGLFSTYYDSPSYSDDFVLAAINGAAPFADLDDDSRKELAIKGAVLQGVWMAAVATAETACAAADPAAVVDVAWALYAGSAKGPVGLAEKRAPQFATRMPGTAGPAGASRVNALLLAEFTSLRAAVAAGNSTACDAAVAAALPTIVGQMAVPIIQGTLREAWETSEGAAQADGAVEVAEGWAFVSAILPLINRCDAAAATLVTRNMDTVDGINTGTNNVPDGFDAVKIAIESVYPCLGISCADVNAMVDPATTALLWQPCGATTGPASLAPGSRSGAAANAASFAAVAAIAVAAFA